MMPRRWVCDSAFGANGPSGMYSDGRISQLDLFGNFSGLRLQLFRETKGAFKRAMTVQEPNGREVSYHSVRGLGPRHGMCPIGSGQLYTSQYSKPTLDKHHPLAAT